MVEPLIGLIELGIGLKKLGIGLIELGIVLKIDNARRTVLARVSGLVSASLSLGLFICGGQRQLGGQRHSEISRFLSSDLLMDRQSLPLNRSPKGNMWSAIPVALLCIIVNWSKRKQDSGP